MSDSRTTRAVYLSWNDYVRDTCCENKHYRAGLSHSQLDRSLCGSWSRISKKTETTLACSLLAGVRPSTRGRRPRDGATHAQWAELVREFLGDRTYTHFCVSDWADWLCHLPTYLKSEELSTKRPEVKMLNLIAVEFKNMLNLYILALSLSSQKLFAMDSYNPQILCYSSIVLIPKNNRIPPPVLITSKLPLCQPWVKFLNCWFLY